MKLLRLLTHSHLLGNRREGRGEREGREREGRGKGEGRERAGMKVGTRVGRG